MQTPISVSRSIQNPIIKKQLECIVTDHRNGEKSEPIKKILGLLVERCQGSAEAFRMQVTSDVDLGFIYREDITPAKFQNLANDWRLSRDFRDDMNAFFQSSLREMVDDTRTEAKVIVQSVGDSCILELERPEGFATFKMSVELKLVAGEELLRHLMYAVTNLRRRNKKMEEDLADKKKLREEKSRLETDYENLQIKYGQLEMECVKKTKRINSLESKMDDITNDMQLKEVELEELRRTFIEEKEFLEEELERMRNELQGAVEDIDMWENDNIALKEERDQLAARVERQNQDLLKYDHILKKYHSAPISVSENKLQELEEAIKEKDQRNEELQNKVTELTRTVKELMTRNTEMQKKTDKVHSDLEKHKRALQAVQNSNLYGPMNLSPQHYGSPIMYRPHSPTLLPPQVGMPIHAASRLVSVNSPLHNIPAPLRVAAIPAPIVPSSVSNETPTFDKEKRKLQQQRLLQANAKGSSENVPPPAS